MKTYNQKRINFKKLNGREYNYEYKKNSKRNIIIKKYCLHGDIESTINIFKYDEDRNICPRCSNEESSIDYNKELKILKKIGNKSNKINRDKLKLWYPALYNYIDLFPGKWTQKIYMFSHNINKTPICSCGKEISFDNKKNKFRDNCEKCRRSKGSKQKLDLRSNQKWFEILKKKFNLESFKIIENTKYHLLIKIGDIKLRISKKNIHFLKKAGILSYHLIKDLDIEKESNFLKTNWEILKKLSIKTIKERYPLTYKLILDTKSKYDISSIEETKFFIKSDFKKQKCFICDVETNFSKSNQRYNYGCEKHKYSVYVSSGEKEVADFIASVYDKDIIKNSRNIIDKELDIFLPDLKLAIEYNGLYWNSESKLNKNYHMDKWKKCQENNIFLLTIWEDDWNNKRKIIKSIINNKIGLSLKIHGRKTIIKEIDYYSSLNFLNENHIAGNVPASINLGLFYNDKLISLMTFGKKRMTLKSQSSPDEYELLRFCNKINHAVVGGANKLFKHFINNYTPKKIISYANGDISNGGLYDILGFEKTGHSINYWWAKDGVKYHRSNFMKHKLVKNAGDPLKTASDIMFEMGYYKIWGNGNLKYEWNKPL